VRRLRVGPARVLVGASLRAPFDEWTDLGDTHGGVVVSVWAGSRIATGRTDQGGMTPRHDAVWDVGNEMRVTAPLLGSQLRLAEDAFPGALDPGFGGLPGVALVVVPVAEYTEGEAWWNAPGQIILPRAVAKSAGDFIRSLPEPGDTAFDNAVTSVEWCLLHDTIVQGARRGGVFGPLFGTGVQYAGSLGRQAPGNLATGAALVMVSTANAALPFTLFLRLGDGSAAPAAATRLLTLADSDGTELTLTRRAAGYALSYDGETVTVARAGNPTVEDILIRFRPTSIALDVSLDGGNPVGGSEITGSAPANGTADGDNTGDGTLGGVALRNRAQVGTYRVVATTVGPGGDFDVLAPDGTTVGTATAGAAFVSDHLNLGVIDGAIAFAVGDAFEIEVTGTAGVADSASVGGVAAVQGGPLNLLLAAAVAGSPTFQDLRRLL